MGRLLRSEILKLRTTPSTGWLVAAALAIPVMATSLQIALSDIGSDRELRSLLSYAGTGGLVLVILGVAGSAGEWRHRTFVPMVLVTPHRRAAILAKALAHAAAGAVVGVIAAALTGVISLIWLHVRGGAPAIGARELAQIDSGVILYTSLSATLGVGIGALVRNQLAAVGALAVLLVVLEPALSALIPGAGTFTLSGLGVALSGAQPASGHGGPFSDVLPVGIAALVYGGYACAFLAAGVIAAQRSEIA